MGYEILSARTQRKPAGRPMISIQPNGQIRFNVQATEILKRLGIERVLLLWDKDKHKIAIALASKNDDRSYKVRYDPKKNVAQVAAKAIVPQIGWNAERSVRIAVHQSEKTLEGIVPLDCLNRDESRPERFGRNQANR